MAQSLPAHRPQLSHRAGDYGVDAPYVPIILGLIGILCTIAGIILTGWLASPILSIIALLYGLFFLASTGSYLYVTRRGKFEVWADILTQLNLHGGEQVLDLGCGRGAVLLMVAKLLPAGKAVGVDLWKTS